MVENEDDGHSHDHSVSTIIDCDMKAHMCLDI